MKNTEQREHLPESISGMCFRIHRIDRSKSATDDALRRDLADGAWPCNRPHRALWVPFLCPLPVCLVPLCGKEKLGVFLSFCPHIRPKEESESYSFHPDVSVFLCSQRTPSRQSAPQRWRTVSHHVTPSTPVWQQISTEFSELSTQPGMRPLSPSVLPAAHHHLYNCRALWCLTIFPAGL